MTESTIPILKCVEEIILDYVLPRARRGEILIKSEEFDRLVTNVQEELERSGLPQGIAGMDARELTHQLLCVQRPSLPGYVHDSDVNGYVLTQ